MGALPDFGGRVAEEMTFGPERVTTGAGNDIELPADDCASHLGQALDTGADVVIIDFEGDTARSLSARRLKRPAPR